MRTLSIIIAHFSVKLSWLNKLLDKLKKHKIKIYVYSKGKELPVLNNLPDNVILVECKKRENVGRNDETFLYHIQEHYDDLSDDFLFLKDSSLKDLHVGSRSVDAKLKEIVKMLNIASKKGYMCNPTDYTNGWEEDDEDLADWTIDDWNPSHKQVVSNFILAKPRGVYNWVSKMLQGSPDRKKILNKIQKPSNSKICYSGIFASTKKAIRKNKQVTYKKLMKGLQNGDNVEAGHYVERIWGILFQ